MTAYPYNAIDTRESYSGRADSGYRPGVFAGRGNSAMKSVVSAIAASILTAFAFTPSSLTAGSVSATMAPKAFARSAQITPTLKAPIVLAQVSPEPDDASDDTAGDQNESGDSSDPDSATQSDDQGNAVDDAQNGDADNGDGDQNAQDADNGDSTNSDSGDDADNQGGDANQNDDSSAMR